MKRFLSLFLSILMLLMCSACKSSDSPKKSSEKEKKQETSSEISIPYAREDGINPFLSSSLMNEKIVPLIYSGLFKIDVHFTPTNDLATGITYDGVRAVVTLNTSRSFSNGKRVSADDVVYSFNMAKQSPYFTTALENISACNAASYDKVEFILPYPNVYVAAALTFPICPSHSADSVTDIPAGAGQYVYSATADGGTLTPNPYFPSTAQPLSKVKLVNIQDNKTLHFNRVIGNVSAVFDDFAKGESTRISGGCTNVDLNNLVYIGINEKAPLFGNAELRRNLYCALDRAELLSAGFEGYGAVTDIPFNFNWFPVENQKGNQIKRSEAKDFIRSHITKYVATILVNSDNNFKVKLAENLASQLNAMGVSTKIESVAFGVYKNGVAAGRYDLYIGEYKMTNDMNISELLSEADVLSNYYAMLAGTTKPEDFIKVFNETQPFIPVCMRYGVIAYTPALESAVKPLPNNPFANLAEWFI